MSALDHIIAARMNAEPSILKGCSSTELMLLATAASLVWLPIGGIMVLVIGPMAIGISAALIVATVYFGGGIFQKIKRGRPDGYYQHWVDRRLHKLGLRRSAFVNLKEGTLKLGRTWRQ